MGYNVQGILFHTFISFIQYITWHDTKWGDIASHYFKYMVPDSQGSRWSTKTPKKTNSWWVTSIRAGQCWYFSATSLPKVQPKYEIPNTWAMLQQKHAEARQQNLHESSIPKWCFLKLTHLRAIGWSNEIEQHHLKKTWRKKNTNLSLCLVKTRALRQSRQPLTLPWYDFQTIGIEGKLPDQTNRERYLFGGKRHVSWGQVQSSKQHLQGVQKECCSEEDSSSWDLL